MAKFRSKIQRGWSFANVRLTTEQREEFGAWASSLDQDVMEIVTSVLLEGYKLSARYDEENECWIATLTGTEGTKHNDQTSMSARHSDLDLALLLVCFKHLVVCNSGTWSTQAEAETWG